MFILKLTPVPSPMQNEQIRELVGFYQGIASCSESGIVIIQPKTLFNLNGLITTLTSLHFNVQNLTKIEG